MKNRQCTDKEIQMSSKHMKIILLSDCGNANYVNNDITISFPLDDKLVYLLLKGQMSNILDFIG